MYKHSMESTLAPLISTIFFIYIKEREELIYPELGPGIESHKTKHSMQVSKSSITPTLLRKVQQPKGISF